LKFLNLTWGRLQRTIEELALNRILVQSLFSSYISLTGIKSCDENTIEIEMLKVICSRKNWIEIPIPLQLWQDRVRLIPILTKSDLVRWRRRRNNQLQKKKFRITPYDSIFVSWISTIFLLPSPLETTYQDSSISHFLLKRQTQIRCCNLNQREENTCYFLDLDGESINCWLDWSDRNNMNCSKIWVFETAKTDVICIFIVWKIFIFINGWIRISSGIFILIPWVSLYTMLEIMKS
jgi:hypothetical protein